MDMLQNIHFSFGGRKQLHLKQYPLGKLLGTVELSLPQLF